MSVFDLPGIWLASRSPRRRELLDQLGIRHQTLDIDTDESTRADESPAAYAERIALEKARAGLRMIEMQTLDSRPVLAADTCVILEEQILGKPVTPLRAHEMLRQLSGRQHQVMTAIAFMTPSQTLTALSVSEVRFAPLTAQQIDAYVSSGEPLDKAGGYAIQGAAAAFVTHLSGSYSGVMGLPLHEVYTLLGQLNHDHSHFD